MESNSFNLNNKVNHNFVKVGLWWTLPAFLILGVIFLVVIIQGGNYIDTYIGVQKDLFFYLNSHLSSFPNIELNLTQLGDVLIIFPFFMALILYAPKLWEALISSSLISLGVSFGLKKLFSVPRPARFFDEESFTILGRTLDGNNSLPSGHSMTAFIVITLLLFAFMPLKNRIIQTFWTILILCVGFLIASSRVGVGAHYPLDVISGASIGYILAIIGIQITQRVNWFNWIGKRKYLIIFIVLLVAWIFILIQKIVNYNLPIFYLSLIFLLLSLYLITKRYVQKYL